MSCGASIENALLATQTFQKSKGRRNVCSNTLNVMISLLWLTPRGPILRKTTQQEGNRSTGSCSTGAALVSPSQKNKTARWHWNRNKQWAVLSWWSWFSLGFFLLLSALAFSQSPLTKLQSKQCGANTGWNKDKHGLLWRVWWVSGRVWWTFLVLSLWCYFFSCWVRCFEKPGPPPRPHLLSPDNQTNGFHCCSQWPPTSRLWLCPAERGCLSSLPGSITSLPLKLLKSLAV